MIRGEHFSIPESRVWLVCSCHLWLMIVFLLSLSVRVEGVVSIVVERYGNGTSKRSSAFNAFPQDFKLTCLVCRYLLDDDDSPLQGFLEEREPKPDTNSNSSETNTVWVPDVVKDLVFPTGFPGTLAWLDHPLLLLLMNDVCMYVGSVSLINHLWKMTGSVSDDYLDYMLWQFPTNVTGWMCNVLVTSSLLKASHLSSLPCLLLILTLFLF